MSRMEPPDDCWPAAPPPSIELSKSLSGLLVPPAPPPRIEPSGSSTLLPAGRKQRGRSCQDTTAGAQTFARHWAPVGSGYALIASTPTSRFEPALHPRGALQLTGC
jgi:hypothetical protein